ncbi:MAG: hypothetical protein M1816_005019 [Peltula sp. TS41687]|nr:MAG: hypothetical protein M1816_005019 [Peltula sp. TS41687]
MPLPSLPPTPASSTDLKGKDGYQSCSLEPTFSLPPPALISSTDPYSSEASSKLSASQHRSDVSRSPPALSTRRGPSRRRTTAVSPKVAKDEFTLPPPPTRARKIIQMKPPSQSAPEKDNLSGATSGPSPSEGSSKKRKPPGATSAAGKKIARKTAHSLIERRRRSKMNEEFGTLKQMIPACRDQEMHKLAILQASIEYMRYLEQCISDLEANRVPVDSSGLSLCDRPLSPKLAAVEADEYEMEDIPLAELHKKTNRGCGLATAHLQSISPALEGQMNSIPSVSSFTATPAIPPRTYSFSSYSSLITSPVTAPQAIGDRDLDHEASEALLLLNSGRRGSDVRGMSVQDLLAS